MVARRGAAGIHQIPESVRPNWGFRSASGRRGALSGKTRKIALYLGARNACNGIAYVVQLS